MTFLAEPARTPSAIGEITVILHSDGQGEQSAHFRAEIQYSDDSSSVRFGNLVPHLTQQQITALQSFMSDLRTQAEEQILP